MNDTSDWARGMISRNTGSQTAMTIVHAVLLPAALIAGLVLSVLSALKICTGPCSEATRYTVFGLDFGWFGAVFFAILILLLALRRIVPTAGVLLLLFTFAAAGAELRLLWLQKFVIGRWCPVCLWIAAAVATATILLVIEKKSIQPFRGGRMKTSLTHAALTIVALVVGFTAALMGVTKEVGAVELDIYLGNTRSQTTVYHISDWFCPSCRRVEPEIERMYPEIAKVARLAFVDMPVHPETANFTPYHVQFLLHEKEKYMLLRRALDELSRRTKAPTPGQIQAAVAPHGVTLRQMNFMEFMNGAKLFESIYRGFGVNATPTVVVENTKTKKRKVLVGDRQITRQSVRDAISEVAR